MPSTVTARARSYLARHEFLRHALTLLSGTAIGQVLTAASVFVLGRLVLSSDLAVYNAVYAVVIGMIPVAALRYDAAIVLPRSDADARHLVRVATGINTLTAILLTGVLLLAAGPYTRLIGEPRAAGWLAAAGALGWVFAELQILSYWLTRRKRFALASQNKVHQSATTAVAQIGAALMRLGAGGLILGALLGRLASLINLLRKDGASLRSDGLPHRGTRALLREYRKMPLLNAPTAAVDFVRFAGIAMLMPVVFGKQLAGNFAYAWMLLQMPAQLLGIAISQVFLQRVATVPRGGMFALCRSVTLRAAAVGIAPFAAVAALAPWLFPMIWPNYPTAGTVAAALAPWLFLNLLSAPLASVPVVIRRQGSLLAFAVLYAALPLTVLWLAHGGPRTPRALVTTCLQISLGMSALLVLMISIMLWLARQFDAGKGPRTDADEAPPASPDAPVPEPGPPPA